MSNVNDGEQVTGILEGGPDKQYKMQSHDKPGVDTFGEVAGEIVTPLPDLTEGVGQAVAEAGSTILQAAVDAGGSVLGTAAEVAGSVADHAGDIAEVAGEAVATVIGSLLDGS